jgi:beta-glucanase (GH16 family)
MISSGPGPSTPAGFTFRYGRVAMRARLPGAGNGLWPAFWLLPANKDALPEIDVMEATGDRPGTVQMHLHYRVGDGRVQAPGAEWTGLTAGWHIFSLDWSPGQLVWRVDGHVRWTLSGDMVPSRPMYVVANLAVGGDPPPDAATPFPASLDIDWIRVWQ